MRSLLLIIITIAGACYGQEPGQYSDCSTSESIIMKCSDSFLQYLQAVDPNDVTKLKIVAELSDAATIININLDNVCNNTMQLKAYYGCVYTNLTDCLSAANSSQANGLPDTAAITKGIGHVCEKRGEMNNTCLMKKIPDVTQCLADAVKTADEDSDACKIHDLMVDCSEKLDMCDGGEVLKDYMASTRPRGCQDSSGAITSVAPVCLLLLLVFHLFDYM